MNMTSQFDATSQAIPGASFRAGDVLMIEATAVRVDASTLLVRIGDQQLVVDHDEVDAIRVQAFQIGDYVCAGENRDLTGVVIGVEGEDVWVRHSNGNRKTWVNDEILRVPASGVAQGDAA